MRSICFVTQELPQLHKNGGAGTATMGFAEALADAGFAVSILYIADVYEARVAQKCVADLAARGISLHFLSEEATISNYRSNVCYFSLGVFFWLETRSFEIIHFNDFGGLAFYSLQAKKCGLALQNCAICVFLHGPSHWAYDITEIFYDEQFLMVDLLERKSIEQADYILSPSRYILNYVASAGVTLPSQLKIQRGVLPDIAEADVSKADIPSAKRQHEIIFFGRHEIRKGFLVFVDAAARLLASRDDVCITFLGREGVIYGQDSRALAEATLGHFADRVTFFSASDRADLVAKLKSPGVLAVIPSTDDNLPNTVFECVQWGINFIASNVGGIPELLDKETSADRLFSPTVEGLISKINEMLALSPSAAKLAFDPAIERRNYVEWHASLNLPKVTVEQLPTPLVTICLVHFDRPQYLQQAINSVFRQTYKNIEIVIVDDGSRTSAAREAVRAIEQGSHPVPIKIVHTPDVGLGAARNAAVKNAAGDYLLFMDDDNVAVPEMIEKFVAGILTSKADAVTGLFYAFEGSDAPQENMKSAPRYLPLGTAIDIGMFRNYFGDAHSIWKRASFEALGGFSDARAPSEDWEIFARASLQGYDITVIPAQLHWHRMHKNSLMSRPYSQWKNYNQIADLYAKYPPKNLKAILRAGQFYLSFAEAKPANPYKSAVLSSAARQPDSSFPAVALVRDRPTLFRRSLKRVARYILSKPIIANPLRRVVRFVITEVRS